MVSEAAVAEDSITIVTFRRLKIRVQAGKVGPFVTIGHLDKESFNLMSIKLVIVVEKSQPMKLKIVGTIKGGEHDGEDAGIAEFIIPTYIDRESLALVSGPAATENRLSSQVLKEFNAVKAAAMGHITGNIHRLDFAYTAPNVTDNMKVSNLTDSTVLRRALIRPSLTNSSPPCGTGLGAL